MMNCVANLGTRGWLVLWIVLALAGTATAASDRGLLHGHVPRIVTGLTPKGHLPANSNLTLSVGLPLRNQSGLTELLEQLSDPESTNFHKFLTTSEFTARFGPAEEDYEQAIQFAQTNRLKIAGKHPNRLVLDLEGEVSAIEKAFQVRLRIYKHPTEPRDFFGPDSEPSVPAGLAVVTVEGLSDYTVPRPLSRRLDPSKIRPLGGSGPGGYYAGNDFRNAYAPGTTLNGAGQALGLLEFSAFYSADITRYQNQIGLANPVPVNTVVIGRPGPSTVNNSEVALDIEVAIAMAPGLSQVIVYEIRSGPSSILSRMANDNLAKQLSSSWTWSGGPSTTIESIFQQMAAQGQSFFQASGDNDAYTSLQTLDNSSQTTAPVDSTNVTSVGGTTLTMNGAGSSWLAETVWNYSSSGGVDANVGSGGGVSAYYAIPYWQKNVSMTANSGSSTFRNVPDVALTADSIYVTYDNGSSGGFAGTSCAAPLWAAFCALVNQQSVKVTGAPIGFLNPALYAIARSSNYAKCFHDVTNGNNIGTNTPGLFFAVTNYDLCTGLGTPNGTNLINALVPSRLPVFITQPSSQTVANGGTVAFSAALGGQTPLSFRWLFNGTNLPASGNVTGTTSNILSILSASTNNAGAYRVVVTNAFGSATSAVAILSVVMPPAITGWVTNQSVECGGNVTFAAAASGAGPLTFLWNVDGILIASGTNNSLLLTNVHVPNHAVSLLVTNTFGSASTNALLLVRDTVAPVVSLIGNNPMLVELGSPFSDPGATGMDSCAGAVPVLASGNVNISTVGTNVLTYTASDVNGNSTTATRAVIVRDSTLPAILWKFTNLTLAAESNCTARAPDVTGTNFVLATDLSGPVTISQEPTNQAPLSLGTNAIVIVVTDASGNAVYSTNFVMVEDTTPPIILNQPQSQTIVVGATTSLSVAATACTPVAYAWLFNGTLMANETNDILVLSPVKPADAGSYSVVVSANGGATTSGVAVLSVNLLATTLTLDSSANPAGYKDDLRLNAAVLSAEASGSIEFLTNGVFFDTQMLLAGQAISTNANMLPRGTNVISTIYSGDATHAPATNTLIQIITNHPPSAVAVTYARPSATPLTIAISDLATNWIDADNDPVLLAALNVSTNGIVITNTGDSLIYSNPSDVADQFICTIVDDWGGTNFHTVNILVLPTVDLRPWITGLIAQPDGSTTLNLGGAPAYTYVLEATTNLISDESWLPLFTNTLGTNGLWQFHDVEATNFQRRFYRLKMLP